MSILLPGLRSPNLAVDFLSDFVFTCFVLHFPQESHFTGLILFMLLNVHVTILCGYFSIITFFTTKLKISFGYHISSRTETCFALSSARQRASCES